MEPVELAPGVYWVGAVDADVRDFHGYTTDRGATYNAYLVQGEKTALVDTVREPFFGEMLGRIKAILDPAKIDHVVVNHVEMDHSGALPLLLKQAPHASVTATGEGAKALHFHYRSDWPVREVQTGNTLSLGGKTLEFIEAAMLHWPDSMATFVREDGILLSNDAFGQHYASTERFDDEVSIEVIMDEAAKYFANILWPLSALIPGLLGELEAHDIEPRMIAPSHGVIWRSHPDLIVRRYKNWCKGLAEDRVLIVYDSMWGSTESMAHALAESLAQKGVDTRLVHARKTHYSDIAKEVLFAKILAVGSPTINGGIFPSVAQFLSYLKGLQPVKKKGVVFGSFGWSGEAIPSMNAELEAAGIELLDPGLGVTYVPGKDDLESCRKLGNRVAAAMRS
ncbi:MAG: FprA family A-type flavoprotein [Deltaproteobacteria bacterium]|nr:FprA family A-type flavoprotein [Deltaproteobacteria bacterium]